MLWTVSPKLAKGPYLRGTIFLIVKNSVMCGMLHRCGVLAPEDVWSTSLPARIAGLQPFPQLARPEADLQKSHAVRLLLSFQALSGVPACPLARLISSGICL